jgi:hypothetical protein
MKCRVCNSESNEVFSAKVLNKYNVKYYHCPSCGFLQTEEPYWLNEAYKSAIGIADTGIQKRNQLFAKRSSAIITSLFDTNKKFLDYAGGYGIFVRMMRDKGFDFYWDDPYADNLFAKGFEHNEQNKYELITAFECFEHFTNPLEQIEKILKISENVIFSTRTFSGDPPKPDKWWYYSLESGQHISFYSITTLKYLAEKFKLHLNSDNKAFHMLSKKKINNFWFNIVLKLSDVGLSKISNWKLKSKTETDHELLTKKTGEN